MELTIETEDKYQLIDISTPIKEAVIGLKVKEGAVVVFVPHTSAAVMTSEDEEGLKQDFYNLFAEYEKRPSRHPDGNAEAHILAGIIGHSRTIPVRGGKLALGTWQSIIFVELDGPRKRQVVITVLPS
jgi:secondary thiamine-phosphate synthase enzyme